MTLREELARRLHEVGRSNVLEWDMDSMSACGKMADEVIRQMEWARRISAGELDVGGVSIAMAAARDAITHHVGRKHEFSPETCEGCEFTSDAIERISAIINPLRGYLRLTLAPPDFKP